MSRPRIRYIKPEIWLSRDFRALTVIGRLTFIALISNADDDGRLKTDPGHLALTYLPGCEPYEIATQIQAMEERRMVMAYSVRGVHYIAVLGWAAHQRVSHYVKSDLPEPPKFKRGGPARMPQQLSFRKPRIRQTYFMLRSDNQVKIGVSRDVARRKLDLEIAAGPLTLLATTAGGYSESWYRKTFSALHTHGEWFRYEEPLCSHIAELVAGSENNEIDSSHNGQSEIGSLVRPMAPTPSPARLRVSSTSSSPTSSSSPSPTADNDVPDTGTGLSLVEKTPVQRIFEAWIIATDRSGQTRLDGKRERLITAALKAYPFEDVRDAVIGWRHSAHHRGENERATVYNDLDLLLRDAKHIEMFRDLERRAPSALAAAPVHRLDRWAASVLEGRDG